MGHLKRDCSTLKGKGLFQGGMGEHPQGLKRHSPNDAKASFGTRSVTNGKGAEEDLVARKGPAQKEVWARLVGRANEE